MDPETRPTEDGDQQNQSTRLKDLELRLKKMELIFKQTRDSKRDDCELKPMLERLNLILSSRTKALFHDVFTLTVTLAVIGWIIFMIAYGSANMEEWTQNTKTTIDTRERDQITAPNIAICALSALEFLEGGHIGQILVEASICIVFINTGAVRREGESRVGIGVWIDPVCNSVHTVSSRL